MEYPVKNPKSVRLKRERKLFEVKMGSFVRRRNNGLLRMGMSESSLEKKPKAKKAAKKSKK